MLCMINIYSKVRKSFLKYLDVLMYEHKQSLKSKLNAAMQEKQAEIKLGGINHWGGGIVFRKTA